MKLREIPKDELELMSYDDIAALVLQETGKKMKLADIFKKICDALQLPDSAYENELMTFFEQMSTNKKFVMLENGYWDLQSRHNLHMVVEDMDEDEEIIEDENNDVIEEDMSDGDSEDDMFYDKDDEADDTEEDELADLMIVDDNDEANLE